MAFLDIFKVNEFKKEIENLKESKDTLEKQVAELARKADFKLSLQQLEPIKLQMIVAKKNAKLLVIKHQQNEAQAELENTHQKILQSKKELFEIDSQVGDLQAKNEMAGYGLPEPLYDFATSSEYKDELKDIRERQKEAIRSGLAYEAETNWEVNGSRAKGRQMIKRDIKALFRSFNNESTNAIDKVTYSNYDRIQTRIEKSFEQHNKMHQEYNLHITNSYLKLKFDELNLAYSYKRKKEEEKDLLREQREREREEKKAQLEIKHQQQNLLKEVSHYENAIKELTEKMQSETDDQSILKKEIEDLNSKLEKLNSQKEDLDYRAQNTSAGYVYIISNIGSFGNDVVKIGVTRRLDPLERINELSSASVPFKFDVHALIFSEDAFGLENKLHHRFDLNRINKVNPRKEYFRISIQEIEKELEKYKNVTVDFHEAPEAEEYRETMEINTTSVHG